MINRFLIFSLLIILGCNSKQNLKEDSKESVQLDSITSDSYRKLFSPSLDWSAVEIEASNSEMHAFIKSHFPYILNRGDSDYLSFVHAIDINNDGKKDFVYSGPGPVTSYTVVSITGDTAVFSEQSFILNMDVVGKKVRRIYTNSTLSTGGPPIDGYSIIDIVGEGNSISFVNRLNCDEIGRVFRPNKYTVFDVESISDSSVVRSEPVALDTTYDHVLELPGNHLGKIAKGTKATVVGQKDSLGINWYFVMIWPKYKIKGYVYANDASLDSYPLVWISEKDCKRILK
jgi:hypothetical protein